MRYTTKRKEMILVILAAMFALLGSAYIYHLSTQSTEVMGIEDQTRCLAVPIIMYHSVCENKKIQSDYLVSPIMFENDMRYLKENGYNTVFVGDLIGYVYEGTPLPEQPIIITLDDGYLNNFTYVLPILEKYDMCATVSVVGEYTEKAIKEKDPNPLYAYLTWDNIKELDESGRIEIGNHTNSMHEIGERRGCMRITGESNEKYDEILSSDLTALQNALTENSGLTPLVFTYPFGFISEESLPIIKKLGFLAALTCYERINYIDGSREQLYRLGRFNRSSALTTEQFMKKIGV